MTDRQPPGQLSGAAFVLDAPEHVPAVWGRSPEVLWSEGEYLLLTGPSGVGKSTIEQQLLRARLGLTDTVLGYPVQRDDRNVLLLALDRPAQIRRSMRRMFTDHDRDALTRLKPLTILTGDIVRNRNLLADLVRVHDAGTLVIDSLKDMANPLTDDTVGQAVKNAMQAAVETGAQTVAVHHHRKANGDNKKPSKLDDVYGSTWITAGAGSVLTVWGEAGDDAVELLHLKAPAEIIGPLDLEHDHAHGTTTVRDAPDAWAILTAAMATGTTAHDVAAAIHGAKPSRAHIERARRKLDRYVAEGHARSTPGAPGDPTIYHPVEQ